MASFISSAIKIFNYASVQLLSKATSLFVIYSLAFIVSDEYFGYITLLQAGYVTCLALFGFNLQSIVVRYYYEHSFQDIFHSLKPIVIILGSLCIIASMFLFIRLKGDENYIWFSALPISGYLGGMVVCFSIIFRCSGNLSYYALSELARPLFVFIAIFTLFFTGIKAAILPFYALAPIVSSVFVILFLFPRVKYSNLGKKNNYSLTTKKVFYYVLPLFFVQLMSLINNVGDRFILKIFMPVEAIGQYGKAYLIGASFGMLIDSLTLLWAPYVVKNRLTFFSSTNVYANRVVILSFILSALFLLFSGYLYLLGFTGLGLSVEFWVISLLILSAYFSRVGYQIYVPLLNALDKTALVAKISLVGVVVGIAMNFTLIPKIGLYGAGISTLASFASYSILSIFFVRKVRESQDEKLRSTSHV